MRLSELKKLLAEEQLLLTRSLGQNFMHDQNQLKRIVGAAALQPTDQVLEVGPGLGALTELLLEQAGHVLAIEKDARLLTLLRKRWPAPVPQLELIHADALDFLRAAARDWTDWKLVSNLPYSSASPLLVELALASQRPQLMVATVQLEVAQRLTASAGHKAYGLLTLLIQCGYTPSASFRLPATGFYPVPAVDSACITLRRRAEPLVSPEQLQVYLRLVKRAFSQRRKMIGKLLKQDWAEQRLEAAFHETRIRAQQRAEELSPEQFARLAQALDNSSEP